MNSGFEKRIYHFKQTPSERNWEEINNALEKQTQFAQKLYKYQQQPASGLWQKIDHSLTNRVATTTPFKGKIWRYAAAAAVLILAISGSVIFLNNLKSTTDVAQAPSILQNNERQQNTLPTISNENKKIGNVRQLNTFYTAAATSKELHTKNIVGHKEAEVKKSAHLAASSVSTPDYVTNFCDQIKRFDFSIADRYMVYSDDNGNAAKLAKKMFTEVACTEIDISCQRKLQSLQEKASSASLSSDFMGFVQMLKQVQEN